MAADAPEQIRKLSNDLREAREELKRYSELILTIQKSIMPQQLPKARGLDLAVRFADVNGAGGDFYDVRPVGPNHWAIVIADVSGHGLAAAAILTPVHALGRAVPTAEGPTPPNTALALVNAPLASCYLANTGQFVTAFVGLYDADTRTLTYASAGHPSPRLVRDDEVRHLDAPAGLPLGIDKTSVYRNGTLQLKTGDRLVMFTDGITESMNTAHEFYGDERLDAILRPRATTAAELLNRVADSVRKFRAGRPASDDETCLVAVVEPDPAAVTRPRK